MTAAALRYAFDSSPAAGEVFPVAPGLSWLRMPLPFALDHINLWLLDDGDACVAVDTGIALDDVRAAWRSALAMRRLSRLIVTHFHPDHLGLASWLIEQTGAELLMTQGEYLTAHMVHGQVGHHAVTANAEFFAAHGLPAAQVDAFTGRGNAYARGVPTIPAVFRPISHGQTLTIGGRSWQVIVGHGHAPEHACLYCAELGALIAGDMALPRISTHIGVYAVSPQANPLAWFLDSLDRLSALPEDTLTLPSHGLPFYGLQTRIAQLRAHHEERCRALCLACAQPRRAAELLPILFARDISDPHQIFFAMGETLAHVNFLTQARRIERVAGRDGIRYQLNRKE